MTFIASVVAKKGVVLIADSLVTTSKAVISHEDFFKFLEQKTSSTQSENVVLNAEEIKGLFKHATSHTKDFQEKLFKFDDYTGIATAGSAWINNKQIEQIIDEFTKAEFAQEEGGSTNLQKKVAHFCTHLEREVKDDLKVNDIFPGTSFIISHYDPNEKKTTIYRVELRQILAKQISEEDVKLSEYYLVDEFDTVVCDGQSKISNRILYGELQTFIDFIPHVVEKIFKDFNITGASIEEYSENLMKNDVLNNDEYVDDMKIYHLTELSLQQAVDLAYLLMKIEIDFQKYTKNIPTVGGVIKMAIIDEEKFRFIAGKELTINGQL
jgi:hypothetical protein